jgi:hypothetical protein
MGCGGCEEGFSGQSINNSYLKTKNPHPERTVLFDLLPQRGFPILLGIPSRASFRTFARGLGLWLWRRALPFGCRFGFSFRIGLLGSRG